MTSSPRIFALIVAAGIGARAGGTVPKQYAPIAGIPLLRYSCEALLNHPAIAGVRVVIHPDHTAQYAIAVEHLTLLPPVFGGEQRTDSVRAGLAALAPEKPDYVLIHDAARPFLSAATIDALITQLTPDHAVVPAITVPDTVRRHDGQNWAEISRDGLLRIQTPQAFPYTKLKEMMESQAIEFGKSSAAWRCIPLPSGERLGEGASSLALQSPHTLTQPSPLKGEGFRAEAPSVPTDEAAVWLAAGKALRYVEGDEELRKVTTASDIVWAEQKASFTRRVRTAVGMGYDVHALVPATAGVIRLGGVDIKHTHQLHGHSDADVVLHAIVDALLGTIGAGDIGSFFPPSEPRWKGANSAIFIEEARAQVAAHGGVIDHLDITIIGEQPKISPHREAMRSTIAQLLNLPLARVSVKATTTEKLGFTGREEGIAAQAVATVTLPMENAA